VIPGAQPDRLWIRQGADFVWIPFPSDTFDPTQDSAYRFAHEGCVTLANMYAGLQDAWKNWAKIKLRLEGIVEDTTWATVEYRLDDETDWIEMPETFETMPVSESNFGDFGAAGKKFQARVILRTTDASKSPKLTAFILEAVTVTDPKFSFSLACMLRDTDMNGQPEKLKAWEQIRILDEWSGTARPLRMRCVNPLFDDILVFLLPLPARPIHTAERVNDHTYTCTVIVQEA
jgi:hypothetical protein